MANTLGDLVKGGHCVPIACLIDLEHSNGTLHVESLLSGQGFYMYLLSLLQFLRDYVPVIDQSDC